MKRMRMLTIIIVSCLVAVLASGCDFWTKDNIVGPDNPPSEKPPPGDDGGTPGPTVSFVSDVLPVFTARCAACHGNQGGLALTSYDAVIAGGNSGAVVTAGDGAGSLLVERLDGTIPPQMPLGGSPLSDEEILLITTWIDEGALNN